MILGVTYWRYIDPRVTLWTFADHFEISLSEVDIEPAIRIEDVLTSVPSSNKRPDLVQAADKKARVGSVVDGIEQRIKSSQSLEKPRSIVFNDRRT